MRRALSLVLLLAFWLQSVAAAPPGSSTQGYRESLGSQIADLFKGTWVFALVSGESQRYALTHAAAPSFTTPRVPRYALPETWRPRVFMQKRYGTPFISRFTGRGNPAIHDRDPLAVARGASISGASMWKFHPPSVCTPYPQCGAVRRVSGHRPGLRQEGR